MIETLKTLCGIDATAGREGALREEICAMLPSGCDCSVDPLGNLIVRKKGEKRPEHSLLLCAHMDEVGLIVTDFTPDGCARFDTVGGIDPRVLVGRRVRAGKALGVIGSKPIHMQTEKEREQAVTLKDLYLDFGAHTKEELKRLISLGDRAVFAGEFRRFGEGKIKSKALDDRFGCAVLVKILKQPQEYDITCVFTAQEEVGTRGAKVAGFSLRPKIALVLEATTACDLPNVKEGDRVCSLGGGPVIPFMDRATVYDKELYERAFSVANACGIPCQTKTKIVGANDARSLSQSGDGIRCLSLSLPCRYLHSACCVADEQDLTHAFALTKKLIGVFSGS